MCVRDFRHFAIVLAFTLALASPVLAQGTIGEAFVFAGGSLKPGEAPTVGVGFAGGWGERPIVSVALGYNHLGNHAVGLGESIRPGNPISKSRLWTLDASFQFETIRRSRQSVVTPYISAGASFLFENFTAVPPTCCFAPARPSQEFTGHVFSPNFSAGVRVPVSATRGIRPEIKVWIVRANTALVSPINTNRDVLVSGTISFYYRGGQSRQH
jgi:hypothetical protein